MKQKPIIKFMVLIIIIAALFISNSGLEYTRPVDLAQLVVLGMLSGMLISALRNKVKQNQ